MRRISVWWDDLRDCCDLRIAGACGLLLVWALLIYTSPILFQIGSFAIEDVRSWQLSTLAVMMLSHIVFYFVSLKYVDFDLNATGMFFGGFVASLGSFLRLFSVVVDGAGSLLFLNVFSILLVGIGLAVLLIGWAPPFVAMRLRGRVACTAAAVILGCMSYLAIFILPAAISLGCVVLLPMISTGVLLLLRPSMYASSYGDDENSDILSDDMKGRVLDLPRYAAKARILYDKKFAATIFVYGFLSIFMGHVLPTMDWRTGVLTGLLSVVLLLVVEVCITIFMIRYAHRENPNIAYKPTAILVALGFVLLPVLGYRNAPVCTAISFAGLGAFMVYFWIGMGNISRKFSWSPITVCTQGIAIWGVGAQLGGAMTYAMMRLIDDESIYLAFVAIFALFAIVIMLWIAVSGDMFANEPVDKAPELTEPISDGKNTAFQNRVAALIERYSISLREADVLELLLKGRNVPFICDELFIAKSTVQTHIKHIYSKFGVSGKQQLIDLFEEDCAVDNTLEKNR